MTATTKEKTVRVAVIQAGAVPLDSDACVDYDDRRHGDCGFFGIWRARDERRHGARIRSPRLLTAGVSEP